MAARSFFETYKELFEYAKHVGSDDPVTQSLRDGIGAKTFLDKYRECEQRQALELRAAVPVPLVSTLAVDSIMARVPRVTQQLHYQHLGPQYPSTGAVLDTFATWSAAGGAMMAMKQHYQQQQQLYEQRSPETIPRAKTPVLSSLTRSRLETSLRQSAISSQEDKEERNEKTGAAAASASSAWPAYTLHASPERTSPQHQQGSSSSGLTSPSRAAPEGFGYSDTFIPALTAARPQRPSALASPYQLPKLADLLIDSSTRSTLLRQRHLDEAKKIELLLGGNCGGRISAAAATSLPPAIRRRLQTSLRVTQRREQLYAVLRLDYETLCVSGQCR